MPDASLAVLVDVGDREVGQAVVVEVAKSRVAVGFLEADAGLLAVLGKLPKLGFAKVLIEQRAVGEGDEPRMGEVGDEEVEVTIAVCVDEARPDRMPVCAVDHLAEGGVLIGDVRPGRRWILVAKEEVAVEPVVADEDVDVAILVPVDRGDATAALFAVDAYAELDAHVLEFAAALVVPQIVVVAVAQPCLVIGEIHVEQPVVVHIEEDRGLGRESLAIGAFRERCEGLELALAVVADDRLLATEQQQIQMPVIVDVAPQALVGFGEVEARVRGLGEAALAVIDIEVAPRDEAVEVVVSIEIGPGHPAAGLEAALLGDVDEPRLGVGQRVGSGDADAQVSWDTASVFALPGLGLPDRGYVGLFLLDGVQRNGGARLNHADADPERFDRRQRNLVGGDVDGLQAVGLADVDGLGRHQIGAGFVGVPAFRCAGLQAAVVAPDVQLHLATGRARELHLDLAQLDRMLGAKPRSDDCADRRKLSAGLERAARGAVIVDERVLLGGGRNGRGNHQAADQRDNDRERELAGAGADFCAGHSVLLCA